MTPQGKPCRPAALAAAALAAACIVAPSAVAKSRPSDGDLSARLAELAKPSVRKAPPDKQARILDVAPEGPGSLLRDGGRVLVEVRFDRGAVAGVEDLRAAGAKIVDVSSRYQTITVAVAPGKLRSVAAVLRVGGVTENLAPLTFGAGDSGPAASAITNCFGAATSEGDTQLNAMLARDAFGVDGTGVTVGVLSDTFDKDLTAPTHASGDVASGDLPGAGNPCGYATPVDDSGDTYFDDDGSDEGRAMAQIVHDLAPGARIAFATAFNSLTSFASNIRALSDAGAKVIVDDVIWLSEPFYQEGPIGVAVTDVTARGAAYFTSAGNNNLISGGRNIASWEALSFRDSLTCPASLLALPGFGLGHCMDFDPSGARDTTFGMSVASGVTLTVDLQWAQPWYGVTSDFDLFLLDSSGNPLTFEGGLSDNVGGSQKPYEVLSWTNDTGSSQQVQLAVNRCSDICNDRADTATPPLKFALVQNGGGVTSPEYTEANSTDIFGPTIFGHSGAEDAMSVGAVRYGRTTPEPFSSRGPVMHYFEPARDARPAAGLTPPNVLSKPDIAATDGGASTFFASCSSNIWRFFGTSASAPHAAAVAALELEVSPGSLPDDIKRAQIDRAMTISGTTDAVGAGLVDAYGAINALIGGSPPGSQTQQTTAANCPPAPPPPPPSPAPAPTESTVFTAPAAKKKASDRKRPQTWIAKKPPKRSVARRLWKRVVFRFRSNERGVAYLCKIDGKRFHQCWRKLIRRFAVGRHVIRVKAKDRAGNVDRTPVVYRFWIKRRR